MNTEEKIKKLRSFKNEDLFRKFLIDLLKKRGFKDVYHTHRYGSPEKGKDIIARFDNSIEGNDWYAFVVKKGKVSGASTSIEEVKSQIKQAFEYPYLSPNGDKIKINKVKVVTNENITNGAQDVINQSSELKLFSNIDFWWNEKLIPIIDEYYSDFWFPGERNKKRNKNFAKPVKDILPETLSSLEESLNNKSVITGVPAGLAIDDLTAGWQNGDLIIIAARPSMGKTAFVLTAALNAAMYPDESKRVPVVIFSLEMSNQALMHRLITMEARVKGYEARKGNLKDYEFSEVINAAGRLYEAKLFIDDTPINLMELRAECRRLKNEYDIGLVIIDYLQLMQSSALDAESREQEIASISRELKSLAKDLDVPVIVLSQLSRAVEQRGGDKRPLLSDLREFGSIEQDADVVIFLYRPEYYHIVTTEDGRSTKGLAEVIVRKQRNGPIGTKNHFFVEEFARFENLSTADE